MAQQTANLLCILLGTILLLLLAAKPILNLLAFDASPLFQKLWDWTKKNYAEGTPKRIQLHDRLVQIGRSQAFGALRDYVDEFVPFGSKLASAIRFFFEDPGTRVFLALVFDGKRLDDDDTKDALLDLKKRLENQVIDDLIHEKRDILTEAYASAIRDGECAYANHSNTEQHLLSLEPNEARMLRVLAGPESAYHDLDIPPLEEATTDPSIVQVLAWMLGWQEHQVRCSLRDLEYAGLVDCDLHMEHVDAWDAGLLKGKLTPQGQDVVVDIGGHVAN